MDWGAVGPFFALDDTCQICRSSSSICDVHGPLWAVPLPQSRVAAGVAMRGPDEADRPPDLGFGMLKAAPIQRMPMSASMKSAFFVLPNIGISSLSRSGSG